MLKIQFVSWLLLVAAGSAQDVWFETTCVTDPHGYPRVHFENHLDQPMVFGLVCSDKFYTQIYVDPQVTKSVPAYFDYQPEADSSINCVPAQTGSNSYVVGAYSYVLGAAYKGLQFNMTLCSTEPGLDLRFQGYTDCELDQDGLVRFNFANNINASMHLYFYCGVFEWDSDKGENEIFYTLFEYTLDPYSRMAVDIEYFRGFDKKYSSCFLVPNSRGLNYIIYYVMDPLTTIYASSYLWCSGRTAFDKPIVKLIPHCAASVSGEPSLELRADVPAYALARCKNGDQAFTSVNEVTSILAGSYDSANTTACIFYKSLGSNTFSVDVEVGWGEEQRQVFLYQKIHTVSCAYDPHGSAQSSVEKITDWFIAPNEAQTMVGPEMDGTFVLRVLDVLDHQINTAHISLGRKIRLNAIDSTTAASHLKKLPSFRALSCIATNGIASYPILRAGCGDGVVLGRDQGFWTDGNTVYSPFFNTFKLRGGHMLWFHCRFTVCGPTGCNGSSCSREVDVVPNQTVPDDTAKSRAKRSETNVVYVPTSEGLAQPFDLQ